MSELLLGLAVLLIAGIHFWWVAGRRLLIGPESFFLALSLATYAASAVVAGPAAQPYVLYIGFGISVFVFGTMASKMVFGFDHRRELSAFRDAPWQDDLQGRRRRVVLGIAAVAVAITCAYFLLLGYYVPWEALRTYLVEGPEAMRATYAGLRRGTSSAGPYLGLGYVSQFKDCLLPLVTILFFFHWLLGRRTSSRNLFIGLLVVTVLASVGTGSRYHLAFFGASFCLLGAAPYMRPLRFGRRQALMVLGILMGALSALTLMMGSRGMDTLEVPVLWAPVQVVERVFVSPAEQRLEVYERFLVDEPPQWGMGTVETLQQILPGRLPSTLSGRLHHLLFGSPHGNVSLDVWGALWYDFRWFGLLFAFGLGFAMNAFYVRMIRGPKRLVRVVTVAFAGLILGVATDLQVLVLHGFVTCFLFLASIRIVDALAGLPVHRDERFEDDLEERLTSGA